MGVSDCSGKGERAAENGLESGSCKIQEIPFRKRRFLGGSTKGRGWQAEQEG